MPDSKNFYLPVARALSNTRVMRERLLPRAGEATVNPGDRVEPVDVVARTAVPISPRVVNIAQLFKVPSRRAKSLLLKKVGDSFVKDEVLARKRDLFGRSLVCRAPSPGRLLAEHNGEVLLEMAPTLLELQANIKGIVANVSRFGVVLHTVGALVQGAWGNGKERHGVLKLLGAVREQPLTADLLDVSCLGTMVVVGGSIDPEGLKAAETQQVRGVIAGSMPATLRAQALAMPFPVMITEGFGTAAMTVPAYELMQTYNGREAMLRAVSQTRWGTQRPEVVVPLMTRDATGSDTPPPYASLRKDAVVRICAGDYVGQTARVVSERPQSRTFESGVRARAVEVEVAEGETVWVPINNLEAVL